MDMKMKKCIACGASFKPYISKQQYCSSECREQSYARARQSKREQKSATNLNNYICYCRMFGYIPYAEYQTEVLRKYGV